jgi:hypothetical protein
MLVAYSVKRESTVPTMYKTSFGGETVTSQNGFLKLRIYPNIRNPWPPVTGFYITNLPTLLWLRLVRHLPSGKQRPVN